MKLYLSSYFFGNKPERLFEMLVPGKKIAIIMNAADAYDNKNRAVYLNNEVEKFRVFGFIAEELDLRDYFKSTGSLKDKLCEYGAIWVMGGNSFVLRRAMRYSGFDQVIVGLVEDDSLVYAGFSAGSVVATNSLKGIELVDNPNQLPPGYRSDVIWEGLGLIDFSIAPHYKSDHPESKRMDDVVKYFLANNMPYKAISDDQAVVVIDEQIDIVD